MSRQYLIFFLLLVLISTVPAAEKYKVEYEKNVGKEDWKKAANILERWEKADPQNPDLWFAQGDWWHRDAHRQESDEKFAASADKAAGYLEKALEASPERLDLWLALCEVDLDLGDLESLTANTESVSRRAKETAWTWSSGVLPGKPDQIIPDSLEDWCWELARDGNPESDKASLRLASLSIKLFPSHPGGERYLGRYWLNKGQWLKARDHLLRSCRLDDSDSEALLDLGRACWETERDEDAKSCYRAVLTLNNDPDAVARARKALEQAENEY